MIARVVEKSGINPKKNFPRHSGFSKERAGKENIDRIRIIHFKPVIINPE
jgi:hypothetical protein